MTITLLQAALGLTLTGFLRAGMIGVAAVIIVIALAVCGIWLCFRRSLPQGHGVREVLGLTGPVTIKRDKDGIPHIYATNDLDAYFGLGYAHAQDRLWQMDFQRRTGQGRVCEILGARMLPLDRFMRTLQIAAVANRVWENLPESTKNVLGAYTAGINAVIQKSGRRLSLPPEFALMGAKPEPWTGVDVVIISKILAWSLGGTYVTDLLRHDLAEAVGEERARQLIPEYFRDDNVPTQFRKRERQENLEVPFSVAAHTVDPLVHTEEGIGSNLWIVDGSKSSSGFPVLANDPHLASSIPNTWYLAHLSAGDFNVIGATVPGIPAVISGRNNFIAWGVTNLNPDVQDLFFEQLDEDGLQAEYEGKMEPLQVSHEVIQVKKGNPVDFTIKSTRHGPIISSILQGDSEQHRKDKGLGAREPIALQWTGFASDDTSVMALIEMNHASSWEEFNRALSLHVAPPLNFGFADIQGNIGLHAAGRIPVRAGEKKNDVLDGRSGANEWTSYIPYKDLPWSFNPPEHYIVSTNSSPLPKEYPHFLGRNWVEPFRKRRICELLEKQTLLNETEHAAIQRDTVSLFAREALPMLLLWTDPAEESTAWAIKTLSQWDGAMDEMSIGASIFAAWILKLPRAILKDELPAALMTAYEFWSSYIYRFLQDALAGNAPVSVDLRDAVQQSLRSALKQLEQMLGPDTNDWRWRRLHKVLLPHLPMHGAGPLRRFFSRSISASGSWDTINIGGFSPKQPFITRNIANYRQIVDLSSETGGAFIQASGQSGHFLSDHYDDFLQDWQKVQYRPMRFRRDIVDQSAEATLMLTPGGEN